METNFAFGEKYFILFASVILCFFRWQFQSMSDTLSTGLEAPKEDLISLLDPGVHILPPVKPACDLLFNFQRSICNQSTGSEWSEVEPAGHVRGEVQALQGGQVSHKGRQVPSKDVMAYPDLEAFVDQNCDHYFYMNLCDDLFQDTLIKMYLLSPILCVQIWSIYIFNSTTKIS